MRQGRRLASMGRFASDLAALRDGSAFSCRHLNRPPAPTSTCQAAAGVASPALSGLDADTEAAADSSADTLSGWWHAARWPPAYSINGGSTVLQTSVACGQRG